MLVAGVLMLGNIGRRRALWIAGRLFLEVLQFPRFRRPFSDAAVFLPT